ncbi:MAG: diguanylate cyclase [Gammaproteobacteria bacterium]|nr:diguanylate cyclase [Gammaproteobacteria bacterium]
MNIAVVYPRREPGESGSQGSSSDPQLFRDVALNAPTMLWVSDEHGAVVFQNEQYLRFTGLSAAQAMAPDSWLNVVHPEDRKPAMQAYTAALKVHRAFAVEYRLRQHDGRYRDVVDRAQPRHDAAGQFRGYIGATFDITERKQQEEALRASTMAIENRSHELNVLYALKSDLQVCRTIEETRPVLIHYGEQLFLTRPTRIYLHNNSRDLVEPFLNLNSELDPAEMFPPEQCWALRKGKIHLEQVRAGKPVMCPNGTRCGRTAYMCVPMAAFGETIGVLQVDLTNIGDGMTPASTPTPVADLERVGLMAADEIGTAIEELKLRARLRNQSIRDPLTLLFNRRYFMETLEREVYRARQGRRPLALLMLDLDHFKQFNDTHGHTGGDLVLKEFGKVLQATVRGGDVACRYGGEEFAVVMLDCPSDGAAKRAEEIRNATMKIASEYHGATLSGVTTSIGIAVFPDDADTIEQLIARADAALYAAKAAGRNRVQLYVAGATTGNSAD